MTKATTETAEEKRKRLIKAAEDAAKALAELDAEDRNTDLEEVKKLCLKHGFKSSNLGSALADAPRLRAAKKALKKAEADAAAERKAAKEATEEENK